MITESSLTRFAAGRFTEGRVLIRLPLNRGREDKGEGTLDTFTRDALYTVASRTCLGILRSVLGSSPSGLDGLEPRALRPDDWCLGPCVERCRPTGAHWALRRTACEPFEVALV